MSCAQIATLRQYLDAYQRQRLRGAATNSKLKFRYALDHLRDYLGREATVDDLDDDRITDWMWALREKVAAPTVNAYAAKVKALWTFLARRGTARTFPEFPLLPTDERIPVAFSEQELRRLFETIDRLTGMIGDLPARDYWKSLLLALWDSGERISATLSAQWSDFSGGRLVIQAQHRKGKAGHRRAACHRLHPETVAAIEAIRTPVRTLIWPWPLTRGMLWYRWKGILEQAAIPADRHHAFHCVRRSTASYAQAAGLDASLVLDHCDRRVTRAYLSPAIVQPPAAADVLFRPTSPTAGP